MPAPSNDSSVINNLPMPISLCLHPGLSLSLYGTDGELALTKLDKINKIASGTFNCIIPIPNCDTLKVTDGRFDIKYY
jgi:hypothetical protein